MNKMMYKKTFKIVLNPYRCNKMQIKLKIFIKLRNMQNKSIIKKYKWIKKVFEENEGGKIMLFLLLTNGIRMQEAILEMIIDYSII